MLEELPVGNIDIDKTIREFKAKIKEPFFNALLTEISDAMNIADKEVRAFDVFNTVDNSTKLQKADMLKGLLQYFGNKQHSTFKNEENVTPSLFKFSGDVDSSISYFLADFELRLTQLKKGTKRENKYYDKRKKMMPNEIDNCRHEHSELLFDVYSRMYVNSEQYL